MSRVKSPLTKGELKGVVSLFFDCEKVILFLFQIEIKFYLSYIYMEYQGYVKPDYHLIVKIIYNPKLKQLSRNLRNNSTLSEVLLWNELKARKINGYQFMRQKSIGNYIVDFYCSKLKLAIEVDGETHGFERAIVRDQIKDKYLASLGIHIIRYDYSDVKNDISGVIDHLIDWIEQRLQPPNPLVKGEL